MTSQTFSFTGYAREYGTFLGLLWAGAFVAYAQGIQHLSPVLLLLAFCMIIASPILMCYLGNRFRNRIPPTAGIKYLPAYIFSLQMLMFACLFCGLLEFCYLYLIDQGGLASSILDLMDQPTVTQAYRQLNMSDTLQTARHLVEEFAALSPLQITLSLFNQNIMTSLFLAALTAFFVRKDIK